MMQGYTLLDEGKGLKKTLLYSQTSLILSSRQLLLGDETSRLFYCDFQNLPLCLY